ncbi:MAG: hypothetical protein HC880_18290, partial [Bacteroidia bacterium]|nr:hypothetical protein [Bacteroidia bacterium]
FREGWKIDFGAVNGLKTPRPVGHSGQLRIYPVDASVYNLEIAWARRSFGR